MVTLCVYIAIGVPSALFGSYEKWAISKHLKFFIGVTAKILYSAKSLGKDKMVPLVTWCQVVLVLSYWIQTICSHSYFYLFHCLIIQVPNTRVCFKDIWYISLTSVHYNLEHELVTESFSPLNLDHTTSFLKVWTRSEVTSHAIPNTVYFLCTLNWAKLVWTGHSQDKQTSKILE